MRGGPEVSRDGLRNVSVNYKIRERGCGGLRGYGPANYRMERDKELRKSTCDNLDHGPANSRTKIRVKERHETSK
mgnify:CR=1 FL=1